MKKILITGKTSYIGLSFKKFIEEKYSNEFEVHIISVRGNSWKKMDFSIYDVVLHVAGKAHADVVNVSKKEQHEYYLINRDLAREVAKKYKEERHGFSQFIYLSSIIVYGSKSNKITFESKTNPDNFYGDSKVQGEKALKKMADKNFQVLIIRLPMIYGPGSKGNFPILVKLALRTPIFPQISNQRSMLYIDNLSEFMLKLIESKVTTKLLFPQNMNYMNTTNLVETIRKCKNKKTFLIIGFNNIFRFLRKRPNRVGKYVNKAFGNLYYDKQLSELKGISLNDYQTVNFVESVRRSI